MLCRLTTPRFVTLGKLAGYLKWVGELVLCRPTTPRFVTLGKLAGYLKWVGRVGVVSTHGA